MTGGHGLVKRHDRGEVLNSLSFSAGTGDFVEARGKCVFSKTTLIHTPRYLEQQASDPECLDEEDISRMSTDELTDLTPEKVQLGFQGDNQLKKPGTTLLTNKEMKDITEEGARRKAICDGNDERTLATSRRRSYRKSRQRERGEHNEGVFSSLQGVREEDCAHRTRHGSSGLWKLQIAFRTLQD